MSQQKWDFGPNATNENIWTLFRATKFTAWPELNLGFLPHLQPFTRKENNDVDLTVNGAIVPY